MCSSDLPGRIYPDLMARRVAGQPERPYLRGRGVGGSSAVNAMVGLWGEVDDYDAWERDHGCIGWAWRDVERYFRRIEVPLTKVDPDDEGVVGRALVESCVLNGWPLHRGPFPLGGLSADVGPAMLTRDADGRRVTAADVYLERARSRPNVEVRCDAVVRRVMIEAGRATGVLLADGTLIDAREVVVCAGAIHSPAILLRSGVELPSLGAGLQDHPSAPVTLSVPRSTDTTGLAVSALARFSSGRHPADLQILPIDHLGPAAPGLASISVALMKVGSRGTVRLDPTDPDREPIVDFALLSDESDRESLTVGMGVLLDLLEHSSFTDVVEAASSTTWVLRSHRSRRRPMRFVRGSVGPRAITCTPRARARWATRPAKRRSSTLGDASWGCRVCGSATPRSCRAFPEPTPTFR